MQKYWWSKEGMDKGEGACWVKYADAEAEIKAAAQKGFYEGYDAAEALANRAVQREREEIVAQLERLGCPTAAQIVRAGKPCDCGAYGNDGYHAPDCACHKKPAKIARLETPSHNLTIEAFNKINELIDRYNSR
jgi:hypothetical protein